MRYYASVIQLSALLAISQVGAKLISFCPGQSRSFSCTNQQDVIVFQSAFWGKGDQCGSISPTDTCVSNSSLSMLTSSCFRNSSCYVNYDLMSNSHRGQCPTSHTELVVNYLCVPDNLIRNCTNETLRVTSETFIHSGGFPDGYPKGYRCALQLTGGHGMVMRVTLLYLRLRFSQETRNCDDPLVFRKSKPLSVYTVCDPNQVQNQYSSMQVKDEMFIWEYNLNETYLLEVSFEASQFDGNPNRGFLFKVEVFGCSNDELEKFSTNATIDIFESSRRVTYKCPEDYKLDGPGIVQCDATGWIGNPGMCNPKGVDLVIDRSTKSTTEKSTTTTSTVPSTTKTTTTTTPTTTTTILTKSTTNSTLSSTSASSTVSTTTLSARVSTTTTSNPPNTPSPAQTATPSTKSSASSTSPSTVTKNPGGDVGQNIPPNTAIPSTPRISNDLPGTTTEKTEAPVIDASEVDESSGSVWTIPLILLGAGVLVLILIFLLIMFLVTKSRRKRKQQKQGEDNPITTLRPSAHACVSIPNSYGGNFGFKSKNKPASDQLGDDTIGKIKKKNRVKLNNNTTVLGSGDEVRISDISYNSSLYEMSNGKTVCGSTDSTTFLLDDTAMITPDYYVERTGYESGTTGFIGSPEDFPEVHFVELSSQAGLDSARHSGLEPIAEESQLHHSDIIVDPSSAEQMDNAANMNAVLVDLQSRNSGGSYNSVGLATIPEEGRDSAAEEDSISSSTVQAPPVAARSPYSRTSLEGTRIPRATLKKIQKIKVDYPLFKDDETGNLENYLEDRRGSY